MAQVTARPMDKQEIELNCPKSTVTSVHYTAAIVIQLSNSNCHELTFPKTRGPRHQAAESSAENYNLFLKSESLHRS